MKDIDFITTCRQACADSIRCPTATGEWLDKALCRLELANRELEERKRAAQMIIKVLEWINNPCRD